MRFGFKVAELHGFDFKKHGKDFPLAIEYLEQHHAEYTSRISFYQKKILLWRGQRKRVVRALRNLRAGMETDREWLANPKTEATFPENFDLPKKENK